jgi:hypothetical protein
MRKSNTKSSRFLPIALLLGLATAAAACTDVDIFIPFDPDSAQLRTGVEATVCVPPALVEDVPYKILFVIDKSLSNIFTDPQENRVAAYRQAIDHLITAANTEFAVVVFNDQAHRPTLGFTRDLPVLAAIEATLGNAFAEGGTNYEDAVAEIYDLIVTDINATADPQIVKRTHYRVLWLSDGKPTFGITDPHTLMWNIQLLTGYLSTQVAEFRLDTLFMEPPLLMDIGPRHWETTKEENEAAAALLAGMATSGSGVFDHIENSAELTFNVELEQMIRPFTIDAVLVTNLNTRFDEFAPDADSDADGIADRDEVELGLGHRALDTDGDGFSDGIEALVPSRLDPLTFDAGCEDGSADRDEDGLTDCEEALLETDPLHADSDLDGLTDAVEALYGSAPRRDDRMEDTDLDGITDWNEVAMHLDPRASTAEETLQRWGYQYSSRELPNDDAQPPCYALSVTNIGLGETTETDLHRRGAQHLEMQVVFVTTDEPVAQRIYRAETEVVYRWPDYRDPASGSSAIAPTDFFVLPVFDKAGDQIAGGHPAGELFAAAGED